MSEPSDTSGIVPVLHTERLLMRGHRVDDFDQCVAMWGDPRVTQYIGGKPSTREECWSRLLRNFGHWSAMGFGYWVVEESTSGRFVGEVGLADLKRDVEPSFDGLPEAGWVLASWSHGRGFATEAVRAALDWCAGSLGAQQTVCLIDAANKPSIRVAEKCGYRHWTDSHYKNQPVVLFRR